MRDVTPSDKGALVKTGKLTTVGTRGNSRPVRAT
jgi:hypothetical protein